MRTLLAGLLILLSGCASPRPRVYSEGGSTMEEILRRTSHIRAELDEDYGVMDEERRVAFRWPLRQVRFTSRFGYRGDRLHSGVDLDARIGTPVHAAFGGVVVYAGDHISGYGRTLILRHIHGFTSIYAHNSELLVGEGDRVIQGQRIALSGDTGRVTGPHLHFEIRDGMKPLNPAIYIERWNREAAERELSSEVSSD